MRQSGKRLVAFEGRFMLLRTCIVISDPILKSALRLEYYRSQSLTIACRPALDQNHRAFVHSATMKNIINSAQNHHSDEHYDRPVEGF